MIAVHKYAIPMEPLTGGRFTLNMPTDWTPCHVGVQQGRPFLWAIVDTASGSGPQRFHLAATGQELVGVEDRPGYGLRLGHLGTVLLADGALVFHLFRLRQSDQ